MVTWEYQIVELSREAGLPGLVDAMNGDGDEGWETYQIDRADKRNAEGVVVPMFLVFQKRQKPRICLADGTTIPLGSQREGRS